MLETFPLVGAIILIINILSSILGFRDRTFFENYSFEIDKIRKGEYYRLLTSGFLHVNTTHLIFNMITLYFFVSFVTYSLGGISFLILYFASLIIGNLLTLMIHYNQPNYSAVGASGAVTGVLFSSLLLFPSIELMIFFIPIPIPGYIFGIGYILYTLYGIGAQNDNIGHSAHFGGAIGGVILTLFYDFEVIYNSKLMLSILCATTLIAGLLLYIKRK